MWRKIAVTFSLLVIVCGVSVRITAQSGRVRPSGQNQSEDKIQLSVEEVLIPINVKSTSTHEPPEVSVADFLVTENGKQQKITAVMRTPANILLDRRQWKHNPAKKSSDQSRGRR
jgi:hypothetical protein